MKIITIIIYWEEKQNRDYVLLMNSRVETLWSSLDESHMLMYSISNVTKNYLDDYYNQRKRDNNQDYWKIYPSDITVLINGVPFNDYQYDSEYDQHLNDVCNELTQHCRDYVNEYVDIKNVEKYNLRTNAVLNSAKIQAEAEIKELQRLQKKYPNVH